jgi:5-methylcytosine-specific restriction endonuclease McrA
MTTNIVTKKCPKCGETKPVDAFFKRKNGFQSKCKACAAAYIAANAEKIATYNASYRAANAERKRQNDAAWHTANADRVRQNKAAYRAANPERMRELSAAWREANPERIRELKTVWKAANPEAVRIYNHTRRARKKQSGGKLSRGITAKLMKFQKGRCACCKSNLSETGHHLDHVMPLALGGSNDDDNVQLLCPPCNMSKGSNNPVDFMQSRGFLL